MSDYVQAFDPNTSRYAKIRVASGEIEETKPTPFVGLDEVEPLELTKPRLVPVSDPLGDFR